jgi:CRISPR/Cas system CSM-associated protein Csm2 small subunit
MRTEQAFQFPNDYPEYFDSSKALKREYLTDLPEKIAESLKHEWPQLAMSQLRAFYSHAKRAEEARRRGLSLAEAINQIKKLEYHANDRLHKGRIPQTFHDFVQKNAKSVNDEDSMKAFLQHFEALVGFCAGRIKERERT